MPHNVSSSLIYMNNNVLFISNESFKPFKMEKETLSLPSSVDINKGLEDLENYVLTLEWKNIKLSSADRVIVEDVHCFIRFCRKLANVV